MKKIIFLFALIISIYSINPSHSFATVGGPIYISDIQTDSNGQKIIYQLENQGGRGCPPELYSYDLSTDNSTILLSCDALEKLSDLDMMVETEVLMSKYPIILKRIDLNKNKITAVSHVTSRQEQDDLKGIFASTNFSIDIFQDKEKKTTYEYKGCSPDQPQTIEGYRLPNSKSLIIILSTKGDCFEGGYIKQRIIDVPNITIYDATPLTMTTGADITSGVGKISFVAQKVSDTSLDKKVQGSFLSSVPTSYYQALIGILIIIIFTLIVKKRAR